MEHSLASRWNELCGSTLTLNLRVIKLEVMIQMMCLLNLLFPKVPALLALSRVILLYK